MRAGRNYFVVFVTAPDVKTARSLARGALEQRLIACANLVPKIESHYWWQKRVESSAEVLCLFKTTKARVAALEKFVLAKHPYDTPEVVAVSITTGTERYLRWLGESVQEEPEGRSRGKKAKTMR